MYLLLPALLLLILIAVIAMTGAEGMWSNWIMLVNVITAGLMAMNFFEPLADFLTSQMSKGQYLWDFSSLWALFAISLILLRLATDSLSRIKVRFHKLIEVLGGFVLSVWMGWVMVAFTATTLHTAPLAREFMFKGFQPEKRIFFGIAAPDRQWLGFTQKMSRAGFSRGGSPENPEAHVFDPYGDFLIKYATRRQQFERASGVLVE